MHIPDIGLVIINQARIGDDVAHALVYLSHDMVNKRK